MFSVKRVPNSGNRGMPHLQSVLEGRELVPLDSGGTANNVGSEAVVGWSPSTDSEGCLLNVWAFSEN